MISIIFKRYMSLLFLISAVLMTTVPVSAAPISSPTASTEAVPRAQITCFNAVQGKIAWDYEGHKQWNPISIQALCKNSEDTIEPARCFQQVMHGDVNWGGGTRWRWQNASNLCESTRNADRTIQCFEAAIGRGQPWRTAIANCDEGDQRAAINTYIKSLSYDPRALLSVQSADSTSSLPVQTRNTNGNAVNICTKVDHSLRANMDDVTIFDPNTGVVFPGALLVADEQLADGHPKPLTLPRAPATFTIDLPGLRSPSFTVLSPSFSTVQQGLNTKLEEWNQLSASQGYRNAAASSLIVEQAHSAQQVALELGLNAEWVSGSAFDSMLKINHESKNQTLFALYKQVFYSVTIDDPLEPAAMFSDAVTAQHVRAHMNATQPPAYVRSVDYGRILLIKMETTSTKTEANLEAVFSNVLATVEASGTIDASYRELVGNTKFTVAAIGGDANYAAKFNGSPRDIQRLSSYIKGGADYSRSNPGVPIAYTVAFLKDRRLARMGFTSDYTIETCVQQPNGYIKVRHDGAYVAHFKITWEEPNETGKYVAKSWPSQGDSGGKTAGFSKQVNLPGDARNVKIHTRIATGLVWQPWAEQKVTLNGPTNRCYRFGGTTLNNWWDNQCS